jgi:8-oxo-dGTP pyrophosphatase MutT (NUDIX family)
MNAVALRRALAGRARQEFDFAVLSPGVLPPGGLWRAAALVPLLERQGEDCVLLTRRQAGLRHHPGQLSFPGGRLEPGEEPLDAALREAREEIGLAARDTEILGQLEDTLVLASPFRLTPFVARVPYPYAWAADPGEVAEILFVPLAQLAVEDAHRTEVREAYGMSHEVHFYEVGGLQVWGATARILSRLLPAWRSA